MVNKRIMKFNTTSLTTAVRAGGLRWLSSAPQLSFFLLVFVCRNVSICGASRPIAFAIKTSTTSVSTLLDKHANGIDFLKQKAIEILSTTSTALPANEVFFLRYCLAFDGSTKKGGINEAAASLVDNMRWRSTEGKHICEMARDAVSKAMGAPSGTASVSSNSSGRVATEATKVWSNSPVRLGAPHAAIVNTYITPSQILTTTSHRGDLVYCIRAGKIDDVALMSQMTVDQMVEFFLYCKEVHSMVADYRSVESDSLVSVITANDLRGTSLLGDSSFRSALSKSSTKANSLYPSLAGPTLLLNLPPLLGALAKLFTPLFPAEVRKRLKFEQGPLRDIEELTDILNRDSSARASFLSDIDNLAYGDSA